MSRNLSPELIRQRLVSIAQESEASILRLAYSSSVAEASDFACAVFDANAGLLATTPREPGGFVGTLWLGLNNLIRHFPPDTLAPGDMMITNDPWLGSGHVPDVISVQPVFHGEVIVGYGASVAHLSDLGGKPSAEAADVFEEGLIIPPAMLYRRGVLDRTLLDIIQANSRLPFQVAGDLQAQKAANGLVARRVTEMLEEFGLNDLSEPSSELNWRAENAMRQRIGALPDGEYGSVVYSDGADEPIRLQIEISVQDDQIKVDYSGTHDQVKWGLNSPLNLTYAQTISALRNVIAPDIPLMAGSLAPFEVSVPEGSVLNPRRPAPTMIRVTVVQNVVGAVHKALAPLVPEHISHNRLPAHFGGIWALRFLGTYPKVPSAYQRGGPRQIDRTFAEPYFFNGGAGAVIGSDGRSALSLPVNVANVPVEVMEGRTPTVFEAKRLISDSGGPGEYRGGLGQEVLVRVLSDVPISFIPGTNDRIDHPPFGLFGGRPGSGGAVQVDGVPVHRRRATEVVHGQLVRMAIPGGGGAGDPSLRSRGAIESDISSGAISAWAAEHSYTASSPMEARRAAGGQTPTETKEED